ncbi:MAG: hypothetical protein RL154_620 [Pseudomonadota bacterium]|jgi:type VI secretion system secreted protein VgrG
MIKNNLPFSFKMNDAKQQFTLLSFSGSLKISSLFEFVVEVACSDEDINPNLLILKQATIKLDSAIEHTEESYISGICTEFAFAGRIFDSFKYIIKLEPNIARARFNKNSRVYQTFPLQLIVQDILLKNGIKNYKFQFANLSMMVPLEYVCQYNESDLDFISRWLEKVGAYYFFEFSDGMDTLVITDNKESHRLLHRDKIAYSEANDLIAKERISDFALSYKAIPGSYQMRNRDPEFLFGVFDMLGVVTKKSSFNHYEYGGNPKLQQIFPTLSIIETQRLKAQGVVGIGSSNLRRLNIGHLFSITKHPQNKNNDRYFITEVSIVANQTSFLNSDVNEPFYKNEFKVIPDEVQYRPQLKTKWPTFSGVLCATIDAEGATTPFMDLFGRYKVKMPFDTALTWGGKASCWLRMVQPSAAGSDRGFHISLLKDDEVIIGFIEGDIDRPIILGAINKKEGVVSPFNLMQDKIKTLGGHEMTFDNTPGNEYIKTKTKDGSVLSFEGNIF